MLICDIHGMLHWLQFQDIQQHQSYIRQGCFSWLCQGYSQAESAAHVLQQNNFAMMKQLSHFHCSSKLVDLTSTKPSVSTISTIQVPAPFRHSGGPRLSAIPAGGRTGGGSRKSVGSPWRLWRRWGFCGLFSTCAVSASDRVRPLPALGKSLWSRCREWGSRRCW